jgi:hypothetical protein
VFIGKIKKFKEAENKRIAVFLGKKKDGSKTIYNLKLQKGSENNSKKIKITKQASPSKAKITHFKRALGLIKKKTLWERIKDFTRK